MFQRIIKIKTEEKLHEVEQVLKSQNIPFQRIGATSTAFPVINTQGQTCQIWFDEAYSPAFFRNFPSEIETKIVPPDSKVSSKRIIFKILPWAFASIMALLCIKYYQINQLSSSDKNFSYSWSLDNKKQTAIRSKTKKVYAIYTDNNFDSNFEEIEFFANGIKVMESLDANEDGIAENEVYYDLNGHEIGGSWNLNGDELFEKCIFVLENRDTITLVDVNNNGVFEMLTPERN